MDVSGGLQSHNQRLDGTPSHAVEHAGGGCVTFGAPMVLYSPDTATLYQALAELEEAAEARHPATPLHFHNFVNNADLVPRLLGKSLDSVHAAMESYIPSMQANICLHLAAFIQHKWPGLLI